MTRRELTRAFGPFILASLLICGAQTFVLGADTPQSADLKGMGAFFRGAGSFNLNTARAAGINYETFRRWKQDLRAELRSLQAQRQAGKELKAEERKYRLAMERYQVRVNPTPNDVQSGRALNALLDDLMDPDISTSDWVVKTVPLPPATSVKNLIFRFVPARDSSNESRMLSRGVIALSRLDTKGEKWPTAMKDASLGKARGAYEAAYAKLRQELLADKFGLETLLELDKSLDALAKQVEVSIQKERGYQDAAMKFVREIKDATRMFNADTVDYAKEILLDTQGGDATTVAELVSFMLKYRLQFASAERSATGRVLYPGLYEAMRQQIDNFGIKPPDPPDALAGDDPGSQFRSNSIWANQESILTVTERNGKTFKATFAFRNGKVRRVVSGTVDGGHVTWLAKDTRAIKGGIGYNNFGIIIRDKSGCRIDITFRGGVNAKRGKYTLYLKSSK